VRNFEMAQHIDKQYTVKDVSSMINVLKTVPNLMQPKGKLINYK